MTHGGDHGSMPPAGASTSQIGAYGSQYGVPIGATVQTRSQVPLVFLGRPKFKPNTAPAAVRRGIFDPAPGAYSDRTKDINSLLHEFEKKSKEEQRKMALLLVLGGFNDGGTISVKNAAEWVREASLAEVVSAYANLLGDSAALYATGQKVTPDQLLRRSIAYRIPGWNGKQSSLNEALAKAGVDFDVEDAPSYEFQPPGTYKTTATRKSLDFMDPMDAKALARGVLQQELGRDPTQEEYEDFISAIHAAERRNPDVTKTTQTYTIDQYGNQSNVNESSVTHQGMTSAGYSQLATEKAQANPNWAEWQAVGTYAPALFAALGSTVPGV